MSVKCVDRGNALQGREVAVEPTKPGNNGLGK